MKNKISSSLSTVKEKASCILIGEDHLILQCAETLLSKNFLIVAIVSHHEQVKEWAKINNVYWFKSILEAENKLIDEQFDYLFSVVNSQIILPSLLNNVLKIAINYHHSPLPKYAGVNATSWAIINNEKTHGVTWHAVDKLIDGGHIIKQAFFNIEQHETAFSLNLKCNQTALFLFEELTSELLNNPLPYQKPQDLELRSYYSLSQKPLGNGWINWNLPAEEIERYFRAFSLGSLNNQLSVLKLKLICDVYVVSELKIKFGSYSSQPPGSILEIKPSYWRVSTATQDIIITQIITADGINCPLEELAANYNLTISSILFSPSKSEINLFTTICSNFFKYESYWIKQIANFNSANFPFVTPNAVNAKLNNSFTQIEILDFLQTPLYDISNLYKQNYDPIIFFLTIWLIYLYRLGNKDNLGIALKYFELQQSPEINDFFSNEIPFQIIFKDHLNFDQAYQLVSNQLLQVQVKNTYLKDIFCRYHTINNFLKIPITIILEDTKPVEIKNLRGVVVLKISTLHRRLEWYVDTNIVDLNNNLCLFVKQSSQHINIMMDAILKNRFTAVKALPLLTADEAKTILVKWNETQSEYPRDKDIYSLLHNAFIRHPNQIAVQLENKTITYEILNEQVNKLAYLFTNNYHIKPQQPIIVYLERGIEWIISLLAILKIGAIYIPVVTDTPLQRFKIILEDSAAQHIVSSEELIKKITHHINSYVRCIDVKALLIESFFDNYSSINNEFPSHNIAYILYTSGTTGQPKGVMIRHYSLVNLVCEQVKKLGLNSNSKVLQFSSIGFDASIWEIFSTLNIGGTLCIPSANQFLVSTSLADIINKFAITLVTLPPTILQTIHPSQVKQLTTVVTAGEPCSKELADEWKNKLLINAYGPTEATVCATMGVLNTDSIIIGKPIANTQAYVLDDNLIPVPVGVPGELYIGGDCVALGYLNQPQLSNRYFISNPFTIDAEKFYKTRDLVRWLPDGNLEYIGRVDNQVKIRGFRIELEAIEAHLLHHNHIAQCAVLLKQNNKLGKFLVAYLVLEGNIDLNILKDSLKENIPHYMIPSFFVVLDTLPLNSNGKVERKLLPEPEIIPNINDHPVTELENELMKLWSDILNLAQIGIHDDFFNLGGNSLLLSQLLLTIREKLHSEIHFSLFLKNPTIASLAELITKKLTNVLDEDYNRRFLKDTQLSPEIGFKSKIIKPRKTTSIFLTGANGFLGTHLLHELHRNKHLTIYCLVRANNLPEGKKIIEDSIALYNLGFAIDDRIIPILGDLSKPYLGISQDLYLFLTKEIDEIYHNGAFVNHLYNYEMLRAANVVGTSEILKLANNFKRKRIHYISTLSALSNFTGKDNYVIEDFIPSESIIPPNDGYSQTKWVSEKLLTEATNRNFSVNIYRPGWIFGNAHTGIFPSTGNHLLLLLKGCMQLGIAPDWDIKLNILPVDFVSKLIVAIATDTIFNNKVFNLSNKNPITWREIICNINDLGDNIKLIPHHIWIDSLKNIENSNALFNLLPLYLNAGDNWEKSLNKITFVHNSNVQQAMDKYGFKDPVIDKNILSKCVSFLGNHY
jgi:amino acid adenylation domain-containing protein/thioester reductase-like protein